MKKSISLPTLKRKRPSLTAAEVPDVCMLHDTTLEHNTHLIDHNYTMCTGQMPAVDEQEPQKKKMKVSVSRDKQSPALALLEPPPEGATLRELQHMLDELNKEIEKEKRQIKDKEEELHLLKKDGVAPQPAPARSHPLTKPRLMKPSPKPLRTMTSQSPAEDTKQEKLWAGFLNIPVVAKCISKGYLVSGSAENLQMDLPHTLQIRGQLLPQSVWDYVAKLKTSRTKELCVIQFQPESEEEEEAYDSVFSYFSSRGQFGVVTNGGPFIKNFYLVPLGAKEPIPSALRHLKGPGLDSNYPKRLLGVVVVQKCQGGLCQEALKKPNVIVRQPHLRANVAEMLRWIGCSIGRMDDWD